MSNRDKNWTFFLIIKLILIYGVEYSLSASGKENLIGPIFYGEHKVPLNCLGIHSDFLAMKIEKLIFDDTKAQDVSFYFATRSIPENKTVWINDLDTMNFDKSLFNIMNPTYVITHGFLANGTFPWIVEMKDTLLNYADANVIAVDWYNGSNTMNYLKAAASTKVVGRQIAKLFSKLRKSADDSQKPYWGDIHLIGHSLGAHISAHAAHLIKQEQAYDDFPWIVSRITGMDPAQPCFDDADPILKLDPKDAPYVDVIHTNAKYLRHLGLGLPDQLGYIDIYPNGGKTQPGCSELNVTLWNLLSSPKKMVNYSICSHGRSHDFFTDSIKNSLTRNCSFLSHRWNRRFDNINPLLKPSCNDDVCPEMGINSFDLFPLNKGIFFVPTAHTPPYCNVKDSDKSQILTLIHNDIKMEQGVWSKIKNAFSNIFRF